jgi:predicted aldo/keto reductase-like oxidoreductase
MSDQKPISRRQLLQRGGAVTGGLLVSEVALSALAKDALGDSLKPVPRRVLGKTGQKIPILLQGGSMSWNTKWDPKLPEAVKQGIDYFDAAWSYAGGTNEVAIGSYLARTKTRDKVWLTTKSDERDPDAFEKQLNESLGRMQTSYVDMLYMHQLSNGEDLSPAMQKKVAQLKAQKKLRFFGFSCHHANVAELLNLAARTPWVDSVMFRYNFRQYGNTELNRAIDACAKAKVGLIAMKTQGSAVSFEKEWQKFEQTGKWNKYQAVLKAVWADERITATVSDMDSLEKIRDNAAAAREPGKLGARELEDLRRYAAATRSVSCDGCDHLCGRALNASIPVGTLLRYLMYHDSYGKRDEARALYQALPEASRRLDRVDWSRAGDACPHGLDLDHYLRRAVEVLT